MTLMEEKTLADHDINVRSIRQELRLLEEQLHGRNEPQPTPTVTADPDTVSRQAVYDTLTEYYHHKTDMQHKALAEALSRVPPSPSRQRGEWLPEYGDANARAYYCSACKFYYTTSPEQMNYCPHCGDPKKKMPPLKVRSSKQTVIERWQKVFERRHTYCKDCERSIYGKYADCNTNIENNGLYVRGNCECRFKVKKEREETDTFS